MFDYARFRQSAMAVLGSIVLTALFVGAAVAPARQAETAPAFTVAQDQAALAA